MIEIESTKSKLSSHGGIFLVDRLSRQFGLAVRLRPMIDALDRAGWDKFHDLFLGFAAGAECFDDMADLTGDIGFCSVASGNYTPKSYADFCRKFRESDLKHMNYQLIETSVGLRKKCQAAKDEPFILYLDATTNQQHGHKIEGVGYDHKHTLGLSTVHAHDQFGYQYWHWVRVGGTFSANASSEVIHAIFSRMPKAKPGPLQYFCAADSAYCNTEFFNACAAKSVGGITPMRANILRPYHIHSVSDWKAQNPGKKTRIRFYDGRECEIGHTVHSFEESHEVYRVIILRAKKDPAQLLCGMNDYDYVAFLTNIPEHQMSDISAVKLYRGRANIENCIKEAKNGFDLKHYPCLKLNANRAYGVIAAFAFTFMRFMALQHRPKSPHYAKLFRRALLRLPCEVVRHARKTVFRFMENHAKEVLSWQNFITSLQFGSG